jgi:hypothetical protein
VDLGRKLVEKIVYLIALGLLLNYEVCYIRHKVHLICIKCKTIWLFVVLILESSKSYSRCTLLE